MVEFNTTKVFTDNIDYKALAQLHELDKTGIFRGQDIRIMPDCHAGAGCVIGTTIPIKDKVVPNLVGVDIACGMFVVELGDVDINLQRFDEVVHKAIPSGRAVGERSDVAKELIQKLRCKQQLRNIDWLECSLGSLGGGNHFIELDQDGEGGKYLVIHSGSRNLGKQVADIYQDIAIKACRTVDTKSIIEQFKKEGRQAEIEGMIKKLKSTVPKVPNALCYLQGQDMEDYLYDMNVCKEFARLNRTAIATKILNVMKIGARTSFTVLHNYIGSDRILRKGAISARKGEKVIIPLNMRDGCILGVGKGNPDWNYSAPHGAGRVMSRAQAKTQIGLSEFKDTMKGIYSSTVKEETIDEAPFAYKPSSEIIELVRDTVEIEKVIKPVYNFKGVE